MKSEAVGKPQGTALLWGTGWEINPNPRSNQSYSWKESSSQTQRPSNGMNFGAAVCAQRLIKPEEMSKEGCKRPVMKPGWVRRLPCFEQHGTKMFGCQRPLDAQMSGGKELRVPFCTVASNHLPVAPQGFSQLVPNQALVLTQIFINSECCTAAMLA